MTATARHTLHRAWRSWYSNDVTPVGPAWLQWALTGVFCVGVALCFTVLGMALNAQKGGSAWSDVAAWLRWFGRNLVFSLVIGYLVHVLFALSMPIVGATRIRRFGAGQRALYFSGIPLLGVAIGWPLGAWVIDPTRFLVGGAPAIGTVVGSLLLGALLSFVFHLIFSARARQAVAEKQALEAQLRLLQGQMEPHFLFNTLAGIQTHIDDDPVRAKRLLESLTDYLRATVSSLRTEDSTLAQELSLAEAYLGLMHQRMEDRLTYSISVDNGLRAFALPSLLLQPLVENAIQHGLEPKVGGGSVHVAARREGDMLVVDVVDDGLGSSAAPRRRTPHAHNGVALSNLRQRLQGRWGPAATLTLTPCVPGMRATLRLPIEAAGAA